MKLGASGRRLASRHSPLLLLYTFTHNKGLPGNYVIIIAPDIFHTPRTVVTATDLIMVYTTANCAEIASLSTYLRCVSCRALAVGSGPVGVSGAQEQVPHGSHVAGR